MTRYRLVLGHDTNDIVPSQRVAFADLYLTFVCPRRAKA